jgi:hypothetical protein
LIDLFYPDGHNSGMKTLFFLSILCLISSGCSTISMKSPTKSSSTTGYDKKKSDIYEHVTIFELVSKQRVQLQFKSLDNGNNLSVIIENGISQKTIPVGHWELTGYESDGISFLSMNTSKKFVLTVKPKSNIYAGSIVIGCPSIGPDDFKLLKNMKFFNRYPFRSTSNLCELVVGNDFAGVKSNLQKSQNFKKLNLVMGF